VDRLNILQTCYLVDKMSSTYNLQLLLTQSNKAKSFKHMTNIHVMGIHGYLPSAVIYSDGYGMILVQVNFTILISANCDQNEIKIFYLQIHIQQTLILHF
jgi:uncharacterized protein YvpB